MKATLNRNIKLKGKDMGSLNKNKDFFSLMNLLAILCFLTPQTRMIWKRAEGTCTCNVFMLVPDTMLPSLQS